MSVADHPINHIGSMGEVVDDTLKVKGANNLRVIDASVFPGHVSGNIMSTTYAVSLEPMRSFLGDATSAEVSSGICL